MRVFATFAEGDERTLISEDNADRMRVFETASAAFETLAANLAGRR